MLTSNAPNVIPAEKILEISSTFATDIQVNVLGEFARFVFLEQYAFGDPTRFYTKIHQGGFTIPLERLIMVKNQLVELCAKFEGGRVRN